MVGLESATGVDGALLVIGVVLLEVIVLYVGYGLLERLVGPAVVAATLVAGAVVVSSVRALRAEPDSTTSVSN
jgi:purine-cytosine permease-like protein